MNFYFDGNFSNIQGLLNYTTSCLMYAILVPDKEILLIRIHLIRVKNDT